VSNPTTADATQGNPCPSCGGTQWAFYVGRARCVICGHIAWRKEVEAISKTRESRREVYVRRQLRKDSDRSERAHAARFGGRTTRGSGCGHDKSDVEIPSELHELKETSASSYRLQLGDWLTAQTYAMARGLRPAMVITFIQPAKRTQLVVLDINDYEALKEAAHAAADDQ